MRLCRPAPGGQSASSTAQMALDSAAAKPKAGLFHDAEASHAGSPGRGRVDSPRTGQSLCNAAITSAQPLLQRGPSRSHTGRHEHAAARGGLVPAPKPRERVRCWGEEQWIARTAAPLRRLSLKEGRTRL